MLYTAAHEEGPLDQSWFVLVNDPAGTHRILTETLAKHATYPFYPIDGYPLTPDWLINATYLSILTLESFGIISWYLADLLYYIADTVFFGCLVERHFDVGLFWFPASAVNVGEPERPFPGFTFILDPDLRRKFEYPFFHASEQPPRQRPASVAVDRTAYLVGEAPLYTVSGTPHSPIHWSSTLNGASTGEVDAFYGQYTDGNGNWSGYGGPWADGHTGTWRKSVKVGTQSAQATFTVNPRVPIG